MPKRKAQNGGGDNEGKRRRKRTSRPNKFKKVSTGKVEKKKKQKVEVEKKEAKWTNKQRVLVFASRGVSFRGRHLMEDIRTLMPHSKADSKMDKSQGFQNINELCEMRNCNKVIFFEARKKMDLYMWISNPPHGPSAKFLVENMHTMSELKMTGNCLKGSRPIVSFDKSFDAEPHYQVLKELLLQMFSVPYLHPKSQPFSDKVYTFSVLDNRIWFRNYQIIEEDASLAEIGPRFALNLIKIFGGSFGGPVLYENPHYVSPNMQRRELKKMMSSKYQDKVAAKMGREERRPDVTFNAQTLEEVFETDQS
ncbi:ribosome biogenesis protein BRX1 homolog [Amphiura filiformis]|uniref:ribosome biogenesis protein BRX1 homolog n=1 Tax=Amphiura filiformis TaxID=82378 RepID=UPI003B21DDCD